MKRRIGVIVALVAAMAIVASGFASAGIGTRVARLSGEGFHGGDPNGMGRAVLRVDPAGEKVCFRITFKRLVDPNYGGIYKGSVGTGGSLEVTLFNGDEGMRPSPIKGCARDLPAGVLREIKKHPRRYFVQIDQHTYANSALRGEIRRPR